MQTRNIVRVSPCWTLTQDTLVSVVDTIVLLFTAKHVSKNEGVACIALAVVPSPRVAMPTTHPS